MTDSALAAAHAVVAELHRRGVNAHVGNRSDGDLATVLIPEHQELSFLVATGRRYEPGWCLVECDEDEVCVQVNSPLDEFGPDAAAASVAGAISAVLQRRPRVSNKSTERRK